MYVQTFDPALLRSTHSLEIQDQGKFVDNFVVFATRTISSFLSHPFQIRRSAALLLAIFATASFPSSSEALTKVRLVPADTDIDVDMNLKRRRTIWACNTILLHSTCFS